MKKVLLLALAGVLIFSSNTKAQRQWAVKLYQNTDYHKVTEDYFWSREKRIVTSAYQVNFSRLSLALHLSSQRKWEHELALSYSGDVVPIAYKVSNSREESIHTKFYSVQYELLRNLTNSDSKFHFLLGGSILPYWAKLNHHPLVATRFFRYDRHIGGSLNLIPYAVFKPTERWLIDLNVRIGLYDLRQYKRRIYNPAIPVKQQVDREIQHTLLPKTYTIRLGIGYRL